MASLRSSDPSDVFGEAAEHSSAFFAASGGHCPSDQHYVTNNVVENRATFRGPEAVPFSAAPGAQAQLLANDARSMAQWNREFVLQVVRFLALQFGSTSARYAHERSVLSNILVDDDADGMELDCEAVVRIGDERWHGRITRIARRAARFVATGAMPQLVESNPVMLELHPPDAELVLQFPALPRISGRELRLTFVGAPVMLNQRVRPAARAESDEITEVRGVGGRR